jgi:alkylhydroperoxidase family enzyme
MPALWRVREGMRARIKSPGAGVPRSAMEFAHLRASQINRCGPCVYRRRDQRQEAGAGAMSGSSPWPTGSKGTTQEKAALALGAGPVLWGRHDQPVQPDQRRDQPACYHRLVTVTIDSPI